jgi:hypothetical protein
MLIRHGVRLPPKCADIFDMIEHSGRRGVLGEVLASVFYPDKDKRSARRCVAVYVNRINDFLSSTNIEVRADERGGPYVAWVRRAAE